MGLLLFYTCCYAVWGQAEQKVIRDDAAELLRAGVAKQGSLQHRGLPQQLAVVAVIMHDT